MPPPAAFVKPLRETAAVTVTRLHAAPERLIVAQIALTLLLLAAASLFVRTYAVNGASRLLRHVAADDAPRLLRRPGVRQRGGGAARAVDAIVQA